MRVREFQRYMTNTNSPPANKSKSSYLTWVGYVSGLGVSIDDVSSWEDIDDVVSMLRYTQTSRDIYNSNSAISDIKSALRKYLEFSTQAANQFGIVDDLIDITSNSNRTTRRLLIEARIGQGKYKDDMIGVWGGCSLTGYERKKLLIASHIKPWKVADDQERVDPYNGFLFLPNIDKLFDSGYISFEDDGGIIVADILSDKELTSFSISRGCSLTKVYDQNKKYLKYHRDEVFDG